MNRSEFIAVTALILFGAFVLGWIASWLVHRVARPARADMSELDRMAQQLHEVEEERDEAVAALAEREAALTTRLAGTQAELRDAMDGLRDSRNEVEDLRDSRTEVEELRDYIEQALARR